MKDDMLIETFKDGGMGEYRFSVYARWQLGLSIKFDGQILLSLPFIDVRFAISKYAKGIKIFNFEL